MLPVMANRDNYGKCARCDAGATIRYREMPTERDKKKGHAGKVAGIFCLTHAYEYESEISPWRLLLPLLHKYAKTPPLRLPDGRLYQMEVTHADRVEPATEGFIYSPKMAAWVKVDEKHRTAPFRKPPFSGAVAASFLFAAVARLPIEEGTVTIVVQETQASKYEKLLRIALRFNAADGVSTSYGLRERGTYRPQA